MKMQKQKVLAGTDMSEIITLNEISMHPGSYRLSTSDIELPDAHSVCQPRTGLASGTAPVS
jgi:hypothetical protein